MFTKADAIADVQEPFFNSVFSEILQVLTDIIEIKAVQAVDFS